MSTPDTSIKDGEESKGRVTQDCVMCGEALTISDISEHFKETHQISLNLGFFVKIQNKMQLMQHEKNKKGIAGVSDEAEADTREQGLMRTESQVSETLSFFSMDSEISSPKSMSEETKVESEIPPGEQSSQVLRQECRYVA